MTGIDSIDLAHDAGLRYVDTDGPGFRRVRRGETFSYRDEEGASVGPRTKEWIDGLAIPPAWEGVWISRDPRGHILATGQDKAGRKQYIYHPSWEQTRDQVKFDRMVEYGTRLPRLRRSLNRDLRKHGLPRVKVVALAVAVLDRTLVRVGNKRYAAENDSYGLTTLTCDHIDVDGPHLRIEFTGKGGADHQVDLSDRRLAGLVSRCQELAGQTLFSYETPQGNAASISSTDVNSYLADELGGAFTAKDARTWGASSLVVGELASSPDTEDRESRLRSAIDVAADRLGNTRAVCRDSYVHPAVIEAYENGEVERIWPRARRGRWTNRDESALRLLLAECK